MDPFPSASVMLCREDRMKNVGVVQTQTSNLLLEADIASTCDTSLHCSYDSDPNSDFLLFSIPILNPVMNDFDSAFIICLKCDYHYHIHCYCLGPSHNCQTTEIASSLSPIQSLFLTESDRFSLNISQRTSESSNFE